MTYELLSNFLFAEVLSVMTKCCNGIISKYNVYA